MNDSMEYINWENYIDTVNPHQTHWTMLHGDFHPANQLIDPEAPTDNNLTLLDWEGIGVG